jgi:iron complex outermembrane receptor protein
MTQKNWLENESGGGVNDDAVSRPRGKRRALSLSIALSLIAGVGIAQPASAESAGIIEELVVTGLRGQPRTAADSAVPIDVFSLESIESVSFQDTNDILQTLIPSYNVGREAIADGGTFIRSPNLRNLPSHHTLVLVNGKRRHRSALVALGGDGTQGPDVATIPAAALESIEVLRDGASAQYGSDAIAGVINFNLRENREGGSLRVDTGQFFEGDGFQTTVQGNVGLPIGDSGFFSLSGEYTDQEFSERSNQYCTGDFCINDPSTAPGNPNNVPGGLSDADIVNSVRYQAALGNASVEGDNVQPWGQPNSTALRVFYNAGFELSDSAELYSFGNYSQSKGDGSFFHRFPGNSVLSDRRLQDGSRWNPAFNDTGTGPNFAAGFTPRFEGEVTDYSFIGGARGEADGALMWDASIRYGSSEIDYRLFNTYNPSLGPDSPTDFKPGTLTNEELQIQLDMSKELDWGFNSPVIMAFGASYLDESYDVGQSSQTASFEQGAWATSDPFGFCDAGVATAAGAAVIGNGSDLDCSNTSDPAFRAFPVGSNGFPGYSSAFAGTYERDSYAAYVDFSADITEDFFGQVAVRFEDYSDFGNETVAKVAGRYRLNDVFALRGSVGTGFRAPTPGQQGTINVATILPFGVPIASGTFPPGGPVAQALGATQLAPETTVNYTLGLTADFDSGLTVTLDWYQIEIDDRTRFVSGRDVSTDPTAGAAFANFQALQAANVAGAETIGEVRFLTNAFDSVTSGVDIVATYPVEWSNGQSTVFSAAMNYNDLQAEGDNIGTFLDNEDLFDFENGQPQMRGILSAMHSVGAWTVTGRASYFGEYENSQEVRNGGPLLGVQTFGAEWFVDLEGAYQINDTFRLSVGGRNIFDEYPDQLNAEIGQRDQCCGRIFDSASVLPWQGGYYYTRLNMDF